MNSSQFYSDAEVFLSELTLDLLKSKVAFPKHWDVDHICFRADTNENYETLKKSFAEFSTLMIESEVNGRLIATYKLSKAIVFHDWYIDVVELPAPKKGKTIKAGFEHIEVVCDVSFDQLQKLYSHVKIETKGLSKDYNQELELDLGERNVKFHHQSLESVINVEKNHKVWQALKDSNILSKLKAHSPFVVGTFPLGIHTEQSDIDIIIESPEEKIENFTVNDVPFEVFAQNQHPTMQMGHIHFRVEERLLKYGGDTLKQKVINARKMGFKTEPAFAKVLNLSGDPFEVLAKLSTCTRYELTDLIKANL